MSFLKRDAIVLASAIAGANLLAFSLHPKPADSLDCNQSLHQFGSGVNQLRAKLSSDRETLLNEFRRRHPNTPLGHFSEQPATDVVPSPVVPPARTQVSAPAAGIGAFGMSQAQIDAENAWDREHLPRYQPQSRHCYVGADGQTYCGEG